MGFPNKFRLSCGLGSGWASRTNLTSGVRGCFPEVEIVMVFVGGECIAVGVGF